MSTPRAMNRIGRPRRRRAAFTLLELLLAMAISLILLAAVYVALDIQFQAAQVGRDLVEQSLLARSLLNQISNNIGASLGTIDPGRYRSAGSQSGAASTLPASPGVAPMDASADAALDDPNAAVVFNKGLQGDSSTLTLYISRVPKMLNATLLGQEIDPESLQVSSDLYRVTYYLLPDDGEGGGLVKQEDKLATSEEALIPPDLGPPDEVPDNLAPTRRTRIAAEVKSLTFSYWDGTTWQESWDGSQPGSDGVTPMGPPLAVAIEIGIVPPGTGHLPLDETRLKYYRHVVYIPVANGVSQAGDLGGGFDLPGGGGQ